MRKRMNYAIAALAALGMTVLLVPAASAASPRDLAVDKNGPQFAPAEVVVGYSVVVSNTANPPAFDVTLTDTIQGETIESATTSQGSCAVSGSTATCNIGRLSKGDSASVEIRVRFEREDCGQAFTNTATATQRHREANLSNNSDSVQTHVFCPGDRPPPSQT